MDIAEYKEMERTGSRPVDKLPQRSNNLAELVDDAKEHAFPYDVRADLLYLLRVGSDMEVLEQDLPRWLYDKILPVYRGEEAVKTA